MAFEDFWNTVARAPEQLGLTEVAILDADMSYAFDTYILWRHDESGRYYWAHDSGCSCPTPFEGYRTLDSLSDGLDALVKEVREEGASSYSSFAANDLSDFIAKVQGLKQPEEARGRRA